MKKNKIYFASDFHLGSPNIEESHRREKKIINWLTEIEEEACAIYLLGDIFDFWFEYSKVVPKGFVRLLGKLALLKDKGIDLHLFVGNHDLWTYDYLYTEIGINIHYKPKIIELQGRKFFIGHGDGIGRGDYFYKFIKIIFCSKICQLGFSFLHPDLGIYLAQTWSNKSRKNNNPKFINKEKEILFRYCKKNQLIRPVDYYIFGHRHIPLELKVDNLATYINLGDWISYNTYCVLDNGEARLKSYKK